LKSAVILRSEQEIETFRNTVELNKAVVGIIRSFHMFLTSQLMHIMLLRDCLRSLHHVEDLKLIVPKLSPSCWGHLLNDLCFQDLNMLITNAPHIVIAEFLEMHKSIAYLSMDVCGHRAAPCPLDDSELSVLSDMVGPHACIASVVTGLEPVLSCIEAHHSAAVQPLLSTLVMTLLVNATMVNLTVLDLDVDPMDYNVLYRISHRASAVISLKLREVEPANGVSLVPIAANQNMHSNQN
ncbi:hypothetical protein BDN67DRAFT_913715, partial [Paxillus ammoniavirescens]